MYQNLNSFRLASGSRGRSAATVVLWSWIVQPVFFGLSPQFMFGWRRFLLRVFGAKIGIKVLIRPTARVTYPWNVAIGDYSWIGDNAVLYSLGKINIGDNVVISQLTYLCTGSHDFKVTTFDQYTKPICIENEAWLATGVFVYPGTTIGRGAVIGAKSSVEGDVPTGFICKGSPAVKVGTRKETTEQVL